jgi:hypothetical protein
MDKVRLFLSCVLRDDESNVPASNDDVENYIKNDMWIEFPTRSLARILEEYESAQQSPQSDLAVRPVGCNCASYVLDGTHHELCPLA